ncbi:AIR carboxylase family protein, partial [Patescibacteria group bacterium]|nr:AIR carboxylase family protein [Patescibacteria group bacterium]
SDKDFVKKITDELSNLKVEFEENVASAHKQPKEVLAILEDNEKGDDKIVYITIAGRSNALSGFCAANTKFPVIACPPFQDKDDFAVNINSTLQMPSNTPVLTVIDPKNAALGAKKILDL